MSNPNNQGGSQDWALDWVRDISKDIEYASHSGIPSTLEYTLYTKTGPWSTVET